MEKLSLEIEVYTHTHVSCLHLGSCVSCCLSASPEGRQRSSLDEKLEATAAKKNLSATNVRSILHVRGLYSAMMSSSISGLLFLIT